MGDLDEFRGSRGVGHAAKSRPPSARALRDAVLMPILLALWTAKRKPRSVVASSRTSVAEALEALDMTAFALRIVSVDLSAFITGTAAGDDDVFTLGDGDLWAWASPLPEFTYFERQGPAVVDLPLFGYFATKVVKPSGLASVRHA